MQVRAVKSPHSITALAVVQGMLMCANNSDTRHLVDPNAANLYEYFFNSAMKTYPVNKGWFLYKGLNLFSYKFQQDIFSWKGVIGLPQHCAMRKLLIEQQVKSAIKNGAAQVIVLGGGFDTLALRLHLEYPEVQFFELDRGMTRETKMSAIDALGCDSAANNPDTLAMINILKSMLKKDNKFVEMSNRYRKPGKNMHFVECDLSKKDWYEVLYKCEGFLKENKSIVILEGVTMYLTMEQNTALLELLKNKILNKDSSLILSFREPQQSSSASTQFQSVAAEASEYYLTELYPDDVLRFTKRMQYGLSGKALSVDFQRQSGNGDAVSGYPENCDGIVPENYYLLGANNSNDKVTDNINDVPDLKIEVALENADSLDKKSKYTIM